MRKKVNKAIWLDDGKRENEMKWHSDLLLVYDDNTNEIIRIELGDRVYMKYAIRHTRYKTFFNIKQLKGMTEKQTKKNLIKIQKEWVDLQKDEAIFEKEEQDKIRKQITARMKQREIVEKYVNELIKKQKLKIKEGS